MKNILILVISVISVSFVSCAREDGGYYGQPDGTYQPQGPQDPQGPQGPGVQVVLGVSVAIGTGGNGQMINPPTVQLPTGIGWVRANATDVLVGNGDYCYATQTTYYPITIFISNTQVVTGYISWHMANEIERFARDNYIDEYDWIKIVYHGTDCYGWQINTVSGFAP